MPRHLNTLSSIATSATDTYLLLRAFAQELARCGMQAACTSPGSRCAPLVVSLAREPGLRCYSHVDERCAGFFALGLAKASRLPVAVACTSGTAVAELLPAAIEAREARVPLLVMSADRPAELRENGAGQAIDQLKLFGDAAKWFFEVEAPDATPASLRWIRTLACRAYWTALEGRPGAVHLNFPLREPLVCEEPLPSDPSARGDGKPYVRRTTSAPCADDALETFVEAVRGANRGVVVAGREERDPRLAAAIAEFCALLGWPLLADPLSGARRGEAAVAHYDALLRDQTFARAHRPDLVLRVGDLPVSKPLRTWLADMSGVPQVALDPEGAWQDPGSVLSDSLPLEPAAALAELVALVAPASAPADRGTVDARATPLLSGANPDWLAAWRGADELAAEAILGVLAGDEITEPLLAAELGLLLPEHATLFVASSMPVRDIETFWPVREDPPRVLCNRGANGIDGTVSSAFGAAAAGTGPVVLLIGDVALAHDIGGLLAAGRLNLQLAIVLLDNDGGGIFDFLPVSRATMARGSEPEPRAPTEYAPGVAGASRWDQGNDNQGNDIYARHITTPTGLDFAKAASLYGLAYERAETLEGLRAALERALTPATGAAIVHARTDRTSNVELHQRIWSAISQAGG